VLLEGWEAEMSRIFGKLKNFLSSSWDDMIMTLVVLALALLTARMVFGGIIGQTSFTSPKGAMQGSHRIRKNIETKIYKSLGTAAKAFRNDGRPRF